MKTIKYYVLTLSLLIGFSCCGKEEPKQEIIHLNNTKWKLVGYIEKEEQNLYILEPQGCDECYTLIFHTDTTGFGKSSSNQIVVNLNKAPFLQTTTMVGEIGKDGYYFYDVLGNITSYTHTDNELKFFYQIDGKNYYLLYKFIGNETSNTPPPCACETVVKTFDSENAIVRYNEILKCYTLELLTSYEELIRSDVVRPCDNDIPKSFQQEGLAVKISGDVYECDNISMPNARLYLYNIVRISNMERR
ncbi:MAG: hypothetical protein LBN23_02500 [Paludibacter sp.]|jgi:hypothetical protein|nr:hypothetical protein [Paludibacter sp.]